MMKRRTAAVATAALLMASTLGLSACSNEIVAQSGEETQSAANLDLERISSVLGATGSAMTTADASLNAQDLSGRVAHGALAYRTAQYALATASGQAPQALDFTPASLAITNSDSWPRAIFNISASSTTALPVLQVFVQDSARSDYQLTNYARLLGGTQLTLPPVGTGSAYVTGDSEGFVVSPQAALSQYITMLNSGSQDTSQFPADDFTKTYLTGISDLNSSVSAAGSDLGTGAAGWFGPRRRQLQVHADLPAYRRGRDDEPGWKDRDDELWRHDGGGHGDRGLPGDRPHAHPFEDCRWNPPGRRRRVHDRVRGAGSFLQPGLIFTHSAHVVPVALSRGDDAYHR